MPRRLRPAPDFNYNSAVYDPNNEMPSIDAIQNCFLGPMNEDIGNYVHFPNVGYELSFDGKLVNGPGSDLFSLKQAQENCKWNYENHDKIEIECSYNGQTFYNSG